jgi:hypothetical protein
MTQIHASTSLYGLGTAKKVGLFVVVDVRFVVKPKEKWYERPSKRELKARFRRVIFRSEEHTSELQSQRNTL